MPVNEIFCSTTHRGSTTSTTRIQRPDQTGIGYGPWELKSSSSATSRHGSEAVPQVLVTCVWSAVPAPSAY